MTEQEMLVLEKQVLGEIKSSISSSIQKHLGDYGSPLKPFIKSCFDKHGRTIEGWLAESIDKVILDKSFKKSMIEGMRHKIAREITNTFGEGIFKANIQKLKADPTLKARCVLAVEKIINSEI
jgi:hypothetical protein